MMNGGMGRHCKPTDSYFGSARVDTGDITRVQCALDSQNAVTQRAAAAAAAHEGDGLLPGLPPLITTAKYRPRASSCSRYTRP